MSQHQSIHIRFAANSRTKCGLLTTLGRLAQIGKSRILGAVLLALGATVANAQHWTAVTTQFPVGPAIQLTDGTLLIQQFNTSHCGS